MILFLAQTHTHVILPCDSNISLSLLTLAIRFIYLFFILYFVSSKDTLVTTSKGKEQAAAAAAAKPSAVV
jgi:hypothetical protein